MTQKKAPYEKTRVILNGQNYDEATKLYKATVATHFYKELPFTLKVHPEPLHKEGARGKGIIVADLNIASKQIGIRESVNDYGISYRGTIIPKEFYVNLEKTLGRGDVDRYELIFVEKIFEGEDNTTAVEDTDVPF